MRSWSSRSTRGTGRPKKRGYEIFVSESIDRVDEKNLESDLFNFRRAPYSPILIQRRAEKFSRQNFATQQPSLGGSRPSFETSCVSKTVNEEKYTGRAYGTLPHRHLKRQNERDELQSFLSQVPGFNHCQSVRIYEGPLLTNACVMCPAKDPQIYFFLNIHFYSLRLVLFFFLLLLDWWLVCHEAYPLFLQHFNFVPQLYDAKCTYTESSL